MSHTYSEYLDLNTLLNEQNQLSDGPQNNSILLIIIHQAYGLWFKEILHEMDYLKILLEKKRSAGSMHTMKRILTILNIQLNTSMSILMTIFKKFYLYKAK